MIKIKRDSGYADRLRAYKIVLDGNVIGEIKDDQQLELNVSPGKHRLNLEIDWCRSNTVEFEMADSTIEFECGSNLRGIRILLILLYISSRSDQYIWLKKRDSLSEFD